MCVGTQLQARSDDDYRVFAQLGLEHICGYPPSPATEWTAEVLTRYRERVESFGLTLDIEPLPLGSSEISRAENPNIMLGKSPERDREIEGICEIIRACATAGIPAVKYNMTLLGVVSTERRPWRGGASSRAFDYAQAKQEPPLTVAGRVDTDTMWERIDYFIQRVVPVAEMLEKPGEEIYDVIRYFGSRNKIFNVHFRNITGGFLDFVETFIDDGDVNMYEAAQVYEEVGYPYMLMPDHVPEMAGDNAKMAGFAYTYGYISALINAVSR